MPSLRCRRLYRLVFVTTGLLPRHMLGVHLQRFFSDRDTKNCVPLYNSGRTKGGFYLCQVLFKTPDGVNPLTRDERSRLESFCTPEGQLKPLLFPHSCCQEKTRLVDDYIESIWSDQQHQDGVGTGRETDPEDGVSPSPAQLLEELAESIGKMLGGICAGK